MTRFTLTVLPDGHSLLTSAERLDWSQHEFLMKAFDRWRETPQGVVVMAETEVVRVESLELDVPAPSDRVLGSEGAS